MTPSGRPDIPDWCARAGEASRAVTGLFGRRLFFLPGTHLALTVRPAGPLARLTDPWHYWWQAHYLDCLLDADRRDPETGLVRLAPRLLAGIRVRNLLTVVNNYYDDMGWLALATLRLDRRTAGTTGAPTAWPPPGPPQESCAPSAGSSMRPAPQTWAAEHSGTRSGTSKTPQPRPPPPSSTPGRAAAPKPRPCWTGSMPGSTIRTRACTGTDCGSRPTGDVSVEAAVYSYNQGPVLGALLELGGAANLTRAANLVDAVARHLTTPATLAPGTVLRGGATRRSAVLRGEGTGDGGLFTGILVRYLALAARDQRLPAAARETAAMLVLDTAEAFWAGRRTIAAGEPLARSGGSLVFSARPEEPASVTYPPGTAVELSTQLQAWMILEAAAAMTAGPYRGAGELSHAIVS